MVQYFVCCEDNYFMTVKFITRFFNHRKPKLFKTRKQAHFHSLKLSEGDDLEYVIVRVTPNLKDPKKPKFEIMPDYVYEKKKKDLKALESKVHITLYDNNTREELGEVKSEDVHSTLRTGEYRIFNEKRYYITQIDIQTPSIYGIGVYISLYVIPV